MSVQFLLGMLAGLLIASLFIWNPWTEYGTLKIDTSNPGKDLYRFEINDIKNLPKKKKIVLKIDSKADLSQK